MRSDTSTAGPERANSPRIEDLYAQSERRAALAANAQRVVERIGWPAQRIEYYRAIDALLPRSWRSLSGLETKPERTEWRKEREAR